MAGDKNVGSQDGHFCGLQARADERERGEINPSRPPRGRGELKKCRRENGGVRMPNSNVVRVVHGNSGVSSRWKIYCRSGWLNETGEGIFFFFFMFGFFCGRIVRQNLLRRNIHFRCDVANDWLPSVNAASG